MLLKNNTLKCYFINKPDSPYFESQTFRNILSFIQTETNKARLKQVGKLFLLVVEDTGSMQSMHNFLKKMTGFIRNVSPATA